MNRAVIFAAAVLTAISVPSARADLIENVPFSLIASSTTTVDQTISIPQFDPAQGTLASVTLTVAPAFQFVLEAFNHGAGAFSVTASDTLSFNGAPLQAESIFSSTIPANQTVYTFTPPPLSTSPLTEFFGPSTLSFFIGTGSLPFDLALTPPAVVQFSGATVDSVLAFGGVSGTVTADFAFTPAASPVPEPGGLAIAGLALIAIGVARKRRTL